MEVTDVRIRKTNNGGGIKAVATITIDDAVAIHDIRIVETEKGRFMGMPYRTAKDGSYRDVAHAINNASRLKIQEAIFKKYDEELGNYPDPLVPPVSAN